MKIQHELEHIAKSLQSFVTKNIIYKKKKGVFSPRHSYVRLIISLYEFAVNTTIRKTT